MKTNLNTGTAAQKNAKLGFRIHLLAFIILTPIMWLVWYLTDTTYPWPLWATPTWAIGIVFHYLGAFVWSKKQYNNF